MIKIIFIISPYLRSIKKKRLEEEIKILREQVKFLLKRVNYLEEENRQLKEENSKLRHQVSLNSKNSSKPPSSDGYKKRPALPKKKGLKSGGQPGHKGNTLKMIETPDAVVKLMPQYCSCGHHFDAMEMNPCTKAQVYDIPEPKLMVTEYQTYRAECPKCGKSTKEELPRGIRACAQYGYRTQSLMVYLLNHGMLSLEKASQFYEDFFGTKINQSTVLSFQEKCYRLLDPVEKTIKDDLLKEKVAHSDETGMRCQGKLHWLHVFSSSASTYLFAHKKRGKEAIYGDVSLLPLYSGCVVHDCFATYFNSDNFGHSLCCAHILRELEAQVESDRKWARKFKDYLLRLYVEKEEGRTSPAVATYKHAKKLILEGLDEEPPPEKIEGKRGRQKKTKGRNLLERMDKNLKALLSFAFNKEVPFTNNQAERDLRPAKVKQKVSGCFRTFQGAERYARIAGFISTSRKREINVAKGLFCLFNRQNIFSVN